MDMILEPMRGPAAKRHDCGSHGMLTVREIAAVAGINQNSVYRRLGYGVKGEALCQPREKRPARKVECDYKGTSVVATSGAVMVAVAVQIALAYPRRPPTVDELRSRYNMSRATAYRWRAAFIDAMGLAA